MRSEMLNARRKCRDRFSNPRVSACMASGLSKYRLSRARCTSSASSEISSGHSELSSDAS
eukprot:CAMPEP_0184456470 /NCGR_PEP_ID=MMETSP0740-20130409/26973_1 /TAXON_ID=385413 /ORGANISM="Thalassiosira miniscula, Strain CCMP1093" /LENGTH=59 /DNA_ID=CAMNT_0026828617 /DNA_START=19 /DNA_END=198 /DNA_ORIENTATION=+